MKDERYNKVFFERAFALRDTDPFEAERLMRVYLYDYPNDRSKLGLYASLLVIIGDFTNAERVLAVIENFLYNLVPEKNPTFYRNILYTYHVTYLKLLIATGRYQEYIDYYESVKDELESINVKINIKPAYLYCRRKLGKFVRESVHRENYSYSIRQAAEYKEDEFIEHIEKHMADGMKVVILVKLIKLILIVIFLYKKFLKKLKSIFLVIKLCIMDLVMQLISLNSIIVEELILKIQIILK